MSALSGDHALPAVVAHAALAQAIDSGARSYERARILPRLLPHISMSDLVCAKPETGRRIVLQLVRQLRDQRRRARVAHWTYDLNRHIALAQAYRAERQRLTEISDRPMI